MPRKAYHARNRLHVPKQVRSYMPGLLGIHPACVRPACAPRSVCRTSWRCLAGRSSWRSRSPLNMPRRRIMDVLALSRDAVRVGTLSIGALAVLFAICAGAPAAFAQDYAAIIAAPDRSDADRQTDKRRQPEKLLAFTGARAG